jgi:hypothetical protein
MAKQPHSCQQETQPAFRLRLVTAGGRGLRPELKDAGWDEICDFSYRRGDG